MLLSSERFFYLQRYPTYGVRHAIPPFVASHSREVLLYNEWVTRVLEMRYRHL